MQTFAAVFGREPEATGTAPGRVNMLGEHTDYNDGFAFPFAIDRRTVGALALREDRVVRIASSFADRVVQTSLAELGPGAERG